MAKRYILLLADGELTYADWKMVPSVFESRGLKVKAIRVDSNPRAIILKTTNDAVPLIREVGLKVGGQAIRPILSSGNVGKLKRRAAEAITDGQIP